MQPGTRGGYLLGALLKACTQTDTAPGGIYRLFPLLFTENILNEEMFSVLFVT